MHGNVTPDTDYHLLQRLQIKQFQPIVFCLKSHACHLDPWSPSTGSTLSEEPPTFSVSTILPGFPELSLPCMWLNSTHLASIVSSTYILSIAAECDADDYGLAVDHKFDAHARYS